MTSTDGADDTIRVPAIMLHGPWPGSAGEEAARRLTPPKNLAVPGLLALADRIGDNAHTITAQFGPQPDRTPPGHVGPPPVAIEPVPVRPDNRTETTGTAFAGDRTAVHETQGQSDMDPDWAAIVNGPGE